MKLKIVIFLYLIGNLVYAQNQKLDDNKTESILKVIRLFQQKDIDSISKIVYFPLNREYPIPNIENEHDFKTRFNQLFDETLINKISSSKISEWSEVGWRGIMLSNGIIWIDTDGKITAVNYQSDFEKKLEKNLIIQQKKSLHISLKNFTKPIYQIKTKNYLIRIDKLKNGNYRYASWKSNNLESTKPELVLLNGTREFLGSGGNEVITFSEGIYKYKIYRNIIGEDSSTDITLEVEKQGKIILTQDGTLIE